MRKVLKKTQEYEKDTSFVSSNYDSEEDQEPLEAIGSGFNINVITITGESEGV